MDAGKVYTDEREVQVSERMTEEAVRVAIEEAGVAEPVFDQVRSRTADKRYDRGCTFRRERF